MRRGSTRSGLRPIDAETQEVVRIDNLNPKGAANILRKIFDVERHQEVGLASHSGGDNVGVSRIRQQGIQVSRRGWHNPGPWEMDLHESDDSLGPARVHFRNSVQRPRELKEYLGRPSRLEQLECRTPQQYVTKNDRIQN